MLVTCPNIPLAWKTSTLTLSSYCIITNKGIQRAQTYTKAKICLLLLSYPNFSSDQVHHSHILENIKTFKQLSFCVDVFIGVISTCPICFSINIARPVLRELMNLGGRQSLICNQQAWGQVHGAKYKYKYNYFAKLQVQVQVLISRVKYKYKYFEKLQVQVLL